MLEEKCISVRFHEHYYYERIFNVSVSISRCIRSLVFNTTREYIKTVKTDSV